MEVTVSTMGVVQYALVHSDRPIITNAQTALELIVNIGYQTNCDRMVMNKEGFAEDFFSLRTGLAGQVAQKFVNYQMKLVIIGDFSCYTSKSLHDWILECNQGNAIGFAATLKDAEALLRRSL